MPGKRFFERSGLGKGLVNSKKNKPKDVSSSSRHSSELNDGADYAKLNLRSVTQQSSLDEFISIAELAGEEFNKDHRNVTLITSSVRRGIISDEEKRKLQEAHSKNEEIISIPRRPPWDPSMEVEELTQLENESILNWRRRLAKFQEDTGLLLTPYEKNIEFWRQLWRVIERSDVCVQVLDARNPLLFLSKDLQKYTTEVDSNKISVVVLNKADLLNESQREKWASYFQKSGIRAVFFSALIEAGKSESTKKQLESSEDSSSQSESNSDSDSREGDDESPCSSSEQESDVGNQGDSDEEQVYSDESDEETDDCDDSPTQRFDNKKSNEFGKLEDSSGILGATAASSGSDQDWENSSKLLSREDLIEYFRHVYPPNRPRIKKEYVTIGLVGYPNVGKSSTINALLQCKKVPISATPGKTKHFQTLFIDKDVCLCDCPGLVFPNFVSSKAEMILNGILPIDQMSDHVPPINLLISLIPKHIFENKYSIVLPTDSESKSLTAEQLLNAYGYMRGFMTQRGLPDNARSARYILKSFVAGKLLYCTAPPDTNQSEYHQFSDKLRPRPAHIPARQQNLIKPDGPSGKDFDENFFKDSHSQAHSRGPVALLNASRRPEHSGQPGNNLMESGITKPWKKHFNRNRKQKLRKAFAHLDIK